jgi:leader peptidase (prepilin peptidase)/N-methyltransferase
MPEAVAWPLALGVLGAILGSFIAALAIRWPGGRSVVAGRSACDACGHVLRARDLVPIASALMLRGRCRDCGARIDPRHGLIEVAALVVGVAAGAVAPGPDGVAGAVFGWLLLALAALDLAALWLPDRITGTLAMAGLMSGVAGLDPSLTDRIIGGMGGFGALWLIAAAYQRLRGRHGLGGGDPKLLGGIGLWLGWRMLPPVLLLASLVGLALVVFRQVSGRAVARDDALPFGAFLAVAAYPAWLAMVAVGP